MKTKNSVVLDYHVTVSPLAAVDTMKDYGDLGNFSIAGFEMVLYCTVLCCTVQVRDGARQTSLALPHHILPALRSPVFEDLNNFSQKSVEKAPPSLLAPYPGRKC